MSSGVGWKSSETRPPTRCPSLTFFLLYGQTESVGQGTSLWRAEHDPSDLRRLTSCGTVMPFSRVTILDEEGQPVADGTPGELCLQGPSVMQGYWKQPELTAATLAGSWLHTGDVGYVDEDGDVFIVDRLKELIKYKGLQVAPAELEAILLGHPCVADAAVIPSPDEEAGEVPKAFVVLKTPTPAEEIMAFVAERVAPHKKIRKLEFIDAVPKSASGKILRRVLIEQERAAAPR